MKKLPLFLFIFCCTVCFAQINPSTDRFEQLEQALEEYSMENPKIDKLIDISITGTLQEFAIAFSKETKLNLTIDPTVNPKVVTNFSDTRSRDILLHLCKFYALDLTFSGTIISIIPYEEEPELVGPKLIDIKFNNYNNKLELNLRKDTLDFVVQKISELSQKNVIASKAASSMMVSGYVASTEFDQALELLAKRNDLQITKDEQDFYLIDVKGTTKKEIEEPDPKGKKKKRSRGGAGKKNAARTSVNNLDISSKNDSTGQKLLNIDASQVLLTDIIQQASEETGQNYFISGQIPDEISVQLKDVTYDQLLNSLLNSTKYSYKQEGNIYLIGDQTSKGLSETTVVQLQHRAVQGLVEFIPKDISESVQIQEFVQLNSLILSGPSSLIQGVKDFIYEIDRSVPVVMIELLIIDVQYNQALRAGFEAGLANEPVKAGGRLFGGTDFTFSADAINKLLGSLSGNGIINLGQVNPNFYATLQAIEDNGYAKIRSKPRLSTLNGVEANLSLGETRYFLNERTTLQGNQNPVTLQDRNYQAVNADFSIRIVPIVSGDEYVTLEIDVNQSDFIGQIQTNAPPAQVNRTFTSNIRILNQEMIVLGGLESKSVEDSGSGVPFLARIPVIKWFFSKRRKEKNKSKLLVFVKPTVIY